MIVPVVAWAVLLLSMAGIDGCAGAGRARRRRGGGGGSGWRGRVFRIGGVLGALALGSAAACSASVERPTEDRRSSRTRRSPPSGSDCCYSGCGSAETVRAAAGSDRRADDPSGPGPERRARGALRGERAHARRDHPGGAAGHGGHVGRMAAVGRGRFCSWRRPPAGDPRSCSGFDGGRAPLPGRVLVIATALGVAGLLVNAGLLALPADSGASPGGRFLSSRAGGDVALPERARSGDRRVRDRGRGIPGAGRGPPGAALAAAAGERRGRALRARRVQGALRDDSRRLPDDVRAPRDRPTPQSIDRGRALFVSHCAVCHGTEGRGDGSAAGGLLQRPADLTAAHTADHTPGDLFWWITHGFGLACRPSATGCPSATAGISSISSGPSIEGGDRPENGLSYRGPGRILGRES